MQTFLPQDFLETAKGKQADAILRSCVHCGFCTATCPSYQILGNELDSPRGRIYLIKSLLEGEQATDKTLLHLDRCLSCNACETTCPSGVEYHQLLAIGRERAEQTIGRPWHARLTRWLLRFVMSRRALFTPLLLCGQLFRPLLPTSLKTLIPPKQSIRPHKTSPQTRKMILLEGCVQPALSPSINNATRRVLQRLGIEAVIARREGCCGALSYHLNAQQEGLDFARRNIDALWSLVEQGAETVISTASGCGAFTKEYGELLADDPAYADKAKQITAMTRDIAEVLQQEDISQLRIHSTAKTAFHCPCTLQHAQGLGTSTESLLKALGFNLTAIADAHLCCGSAGTYSILQPKISQQLKQRKITALEAGTPEQIVSANIGCITHLSSGTEKPVKHWIELLEESLAPGWELTACSKSIQST
ncbi:MAG: glycolate oxidase subunit GlcF [Pseudomonadales bacterium]